MLGTTLFKGGIVILRKGAWIIIGMIFVTFSATTSYAQDSPTIADRTASATENRILEIESEYLTPLHSNRQIETASMSLFKSLRPSENGHISYYTGLTLTHAWGAIIRNNQEYQEVRDDCSAYGIGPVFLMRYEPLRRERWSLALDASGGFLIYNEDFPAGGDIYNFMWRIGPKLTYKINERFSFNLGYKWMHVSNGQKYHNPAYDARGPSLGVTISF